MKLSITICKNFKQKLLYSSNNDPYDNDRIDERLTEIEAKMILANYNRMVLCKFVSRIIL